MSKGISKSLEDITANQKVVSITKINYHEFENSKELECALELNDQTKIRFGIWRLIYNHSCLSNFDHNQKYGLPDKIHAGKTLKQLLEGVVIKKISLNSKTKDIEIDFENSYYLQIFNLTGYEMFEIQFSNGTGEYSNYLWGENY